MNGYYEHFHRREVLKNPREFVGFHVGEIVPTHPVM
jgi:hypothetical protein